MRVFRKEYIPKPRSFLPEIDKKHLDIEIGCGVGLHAVEYCLKNQERTLVAIDRSGLRYQKMLDRIQEIGKIPNLIPIREDAIRFVTHEILENSVENYFFLYPNPSPKKSQANKRWHNMPFMKHIIDTLKMGGKMHVATNMKFYAEEVEDLLVNEWKFKLVKKEVYSSLEEIPFPPRTHFEKKYLERGETCWNKIFEKVKK